MNSTLVLCSVQSALLGRVTQNLRAVYVTIEENSILLQFYYDKTPSEIEEELSSLVDTYVLADFPSQTYSEGYKIITLPYPEKIQQNGLCAYQRYEG